MNRIVSTGHNGVLNLRGAMIEGPDRDAPRTHLRWMINPHSGMPSVFTVWRRPMDTSVFDKETFVNASGWEPIETVGLPVDSDWPGYPAVDQGPLSSPMQPFDAALQRLRENTPRTGWDSGIEDWVEPSVDVYLDHLISGPIFNGLRAMLEAGTPSTEHVNFAVSQREGNAGRLLPRLVLENISATTQEPAASTYHPFRLMCLSASADPLAALAFGFGTGFIDEFLGESCFMVTFTHSTDRGEVEFADVVWPRRLEAPLDPPTGLSARVSSHTRPQRTDGPALDTVSVGWTRPLPPFVDPQLIAQDEQTFPASYAIGRKDRQFGPVILLTPRHSDIGGWLSYVPSAGEGHLSSFEDHVVRQRWVDGSIRPYPGAMGFLYFVAAQDIFGRFSQWNEVEFTIPAEPLRLPQINRVRLVEQRIVPPDGPNKKVAGAIEIDFSWDWSDRSPEVIELNASWEGGPVSRTLTLQFDGEDAPPHTPDVFPLSPQLDPARDYGTQQDAASGPGTRHYRWRIALDDIFPGGEAKRVFEVKARGSMHIYAQAGAVAPLSGFTPVQKLELLNPLPPPGPAIQPTEAPLWASLPDTLGVSRFDLSWPLVTDATGYHIYEATETSLLSALGIAGPDLAVAFTDRLRTLRQKPIAAHRRAFRRITDTPVVSPPHEVSLPRGSRVIHMFTVLAQNGNGVSSDWPGDSGKFIAVAAPRQIIPAAPALFVTPTTAGARVEVQIAPGAGDVEIFRTQNSSAAHTLDHMGPVHRTLASDGSGSVSFDDPLPPSWWPYLYRAQVWSKEDLQRGLREARSPSSPLVTLFAPPLEIGAPTDLAVNLPPSTTTASLLGWRSDVPLVATPLGPFEMIVEVRDVDGLSQQRLAIDPSSVPVYSSVGAGPSPSTALILFRVNAPVPRFHLWMPREAETARHVTIKLIDPRGPLRLVAVNVPPIIFDIVSIP